MEKEKGLSIFRKPDLKQALLDVREQGAALIPGLLHEDFRMNLLAEIERGPLFCAVKEEIGRVRQRFQSFSFPGGNIPLPWLRTLRAGTDRIIRNQCGEFPGLRGWTTKEVAVQKYSSDGCITSHRDLKRNCAVIVIYNLTGSCTFEILGSNADDRNGSALFSFEPRAGDGIILRGTCLTGLASDDRPFHRVSGACGGEPRISAAFRDLSWTGAFHPASMPQGF